MRLSQHSQFELHQRTLGVCRHLCSCVFECDETALEVHTQWVRSQTSPFSSRSIRCASQGSKSEIRVRDVSRFSQGQQHAA
jgi:hypothetical protein